MASVTPFSINVPEAAIVRLRQKLELSDFPSEITDTEPWRRGPPVSEIRRLAHYWQNGFDWRGVEARLNTFPQFRTDVDVEGHGPKNIHFIHQRSTTEKAIPLLFIHGWPGSFVEVTKILPHLIDGGHDHPSFHVVAPSLVDFGFSSASTKVSGELLETRPKLTRSKKGFQLDQHAEVCHRLMHRLGYEEYIVQGGDLGSAIARVMASKYGPTHCKAYHTNTVITAEPAADKFPELHALAQEEPLTEKELAGIERSSTMAKSEMAYYALQSSKPLTISYSLASSPVGLLAWLCEKLHGWSDDYQWTDDEVLTWVGIYYFSTAGSAASINLYFENDNRNPPLAAELMAYNPSVPIGVSHFLKDIVVFPKLWDYTLGRIVFQAEHDKGGHFAAWECPDAIVADLRTMFGKGGGAFACVVGNNGYGS